jgi:hypothetical protein
MNITITQEAVLKVNGGGGAIPFLNVYQLTAGSFTGQLGPVCVFVCLCVARGLSVSAVKAVSPPELRATLALSPERLQVSDE